MNSLILGVFTEKVLYKSEIKTYKKDDIKYNSLPPLLLLRENYDL